MTAFVDTDQSRAAPSSCELDVRSFNGQSGQTKSLYSLSGGRGKISSLMGEVGKGITSFKKGIKDGENELADETAEAAKDITPQTSETEKDKV